MHAQEQLAVIIVIILLPCCKWVMHCGVVAV
jgi:hypothetical protein